ncbi:hypothetical protein ACV8UM_16470, partial [Citrobacter portucalensis]
QTGNQKQAKQYRLKVRAGLGGNMTGNPLTLQLLTRKLHKEPLVEHRFKPCSAGLFYTFKRFYFSASPGLFEKKSNLLTWFYLNDRGKTDDYWICTRKLKPPGYRDADARTSGSRL